jgi:hypothetical protein
MQVRPPSPPHQIVKIRSGDVLCYRSRGVLSRLIQIKTWSVVSHCEGYVGGGRSVAARDGLGVANYPLRLEGLYAVVRPCASFNLGSAMAWFDTVDGQEYDWLGLTAFFIARLQGRENQKMFCSEFLTRWQRHGGIQPFADGYDADAVSPGMFLSSPAYRVVWHV